MSQSKQAMFSVLIMLSLAVLACSLSTAKPTTVVPSPAPTLTPAVETSAPTQVFSPPEATVTSSSMGTSGSLIDLTQELDALVSYQSVFNAGVTSKDTAGNDTQGSLQVTQDKINADKSKHSVITINGTLGMLNAGSAQLELYEMGDISYLINQANPGQLSCYSYPTGQIPFQAMLVNPSDIIGVIHDAKLVKKGETVNGTVADHYGFDQSNLTGSKLSDAKGDVWIAQDGNYVVKLTGTAVGINKIMLSDPNANLKYEYNVDQIGKVAQITVPKDCGASQP